MADLLLELLAAPVTGVRAMTRSKPARLEIDLDVTSEAVPSVRAIVRAHLGLWGLSRLSSRVELTTTELLTNVLRHTQPEARTGARSARLMVTRLSGALNICVRDFDVALPELAHAGLEAESGRGLQLVVASADDFGYSLITGGKDVWANFFISEADANESPRGRGES
ncbi:ATP-binding protein [Streptomyces chartreusis]|uniref:ATP-binding protein n=1 Tax=Streptomyces chartreusis TaxID=1969 RepID=UPI0036623984